MALTKTQVSELYVAIFNRASEGAGNTFWQARGSAAEVAQEMLDTVDAKEYFGTALDDDKAFIEHIYINTLGKTYADDAEGIDFWVARLAGGESRGEVVAALVVAATDPQYAGTAAQKQFLNRVEVSNYAADAVADAPANYKQSMGFDGDLTVTDDAATVGAAKGNVDKLAGDKPGVDGKSFQLTQKADIITGTDGDDVFVAPVTQNETGSGELANTFETGDVLNGGAGRDVLRADLIDTGTIQDGQFSAVISATTTGIEEVYLRAQRANQDNEIDAEKMAGVEQWWTDNSRANITIEDIRTDTAATTFGMRLTDPGVSFSNYFNALFLEGDKSATSAMTLNIYEGPLGAPNAATQLTNISVREVAFKLDGKQVTLDTAAIRAADTWNELETALNAALAETEGADSLTLVNRGNGQFVIEDTKGRVFEVKDGEALVLSVTNNITVTNSLTVGREEVTGPVISNAILDGAGNGSQGGTLNIGAMSGLRGVEELNLSVDRDSHVTSITSFNQTPGQYAVKRDGSANEHLEVVDVTSIGAEGDLTVGRTNPNAIDGRVLTWNNVAGVVATGGTGDSGFVNLRELNTADFNGALNVALTLDNNTISRYLDAATEAVTFSYNGGAQNDIFNIADVSTLNVSGDQDFAMEVDMGAGDDRLVLTGFTARAVSVDGGEGENSIVVAQSHGTNAANTFEAFANFQTYEVEGANNTVHDFTSMSGVQNVIIANNAAVNTQLIDLEAAQNVTVSGKNQTIGNASTADQNFGTITLTNDAGADRTITLDNTARLSNSTNGVRQDGVLTVGNLLIDTNPATAVGATKTVTIESEGNRTSANAIAWFDGRDVEKLNLVGTQDLTINVREMANQAANLAPGTNTSTRVDVDASGLTGNLNLALNGAMLNNFGTTPPVPAQQDTIVGTAGANDTVMFYGALAAGNNTRATGIETVQLGSWGGAGTAVDATGTAIIGGSAWTMYGDLQINAAVAGTLNVANLGVSNYVLANLGGTLDLNSLSSGSTVTLGDAARNVAGDRVAAQSVAQQINLVSSATNAASTQESVTIHRLGNIASGDVSNIAVGDDATVGGVAVAPGAGGFKTINLVVDHAIDQAANLSTLSNINLDVGSQARTLNVTGGTSPTNVIQQVEIQSVEVTALAGAGDTVTINGLGGVAVTTAVLAATDDGANIAAALNTAFGLLTPAQQAASGIAGFTGTDAAGGINGTVNIIYQADAGDNGNVPPATTGVTGTVVLGLVAQTLQQGSNTGADVIDLTADALGTNTNELANSLEKIDLSGFNGQVTLTMEQGAIAGTQTDVNFVLTEYNANITLSNGAAGTYAGITHNSVFDFTGAGTVQVPTQWTVANVVNAVDASVAGTDHGDVNNNTLFDVRDLGIQNYAELKVLYVNDGDIATDAYGNVLGAGQAVVRAESEHLSGNVTWEIVVTGIADATGGTGALTALGSALGEANFGF